MVVGCFSCLIVGLGGMLASIPRSAMVNAGIGLDVTIDPVLCGMGREVHSGQKDREDDRKSDQHTPHGPAHSNDWLIGQFTGHDGTSSAIETL
jgi:hypothetical protein